MSTHIANELPRLLTGEANRDEVMAAAAHLRSCVDCQQELVSAVVAHASLTSAYRFAPEIVSGLAHDLFGTPDTGELPQPELEGDAEVGADGAVEARATAPEHGQSAHPLPDLSAMFAKVREEAAAPRRAGRSRHAPPRSRWLVAAAAAVVLAGGGTAAYLATTTSGSTGGHGGTTAGREVQLSAFDQGTRPATATITAAGTMHIDATSLPTLQGKRYEVWLTNDGRTRMQPVGWIGPDGTASITVPPDLMSEYSDLEVSVQDVNASDYAFSGTSVLRGYYA